MCRYRISLSASALLGCALLSAACGTPTSSPPPPVVTRLQVERPEIPADLLRCQAEPAPLPPAPTEDEAAEYLVDGLIAGRDCRARLEEVRKLVEGPPPPMAD